MTTSEEIKLAESICRCHAQTLVDENGGITIGGATLAELHFKKWQDGTSAQALRHWVESAGYNERGNFEFVLSNNIMNC